jgi:hypothetical protein
MLKIFFYFIIILLCTCNINAWSLLAQKEKIRAFEFLDNMQASNKCLGSEYSVVDMGEYRGGFASQFQLAASQWLMAISTHNYKVPVLIIGHLLGYTDGTQCDYIKNDWTCLFQQPSPCSDKLLNNGKRIDWKYRNVDESMVPIEFAHMGLPWWWGLIQLYMFRFQKPVQSYINLEIANMDNGKSFLSGIPTAGVHVRHGDKSSDGFKDIELESEMVAISHSPECVANHVVIDSNKVEKKNSLEEEFTKIKCLTKLSTDSFDKLKNTKDKIIVYNYENTEYTPLRLFVASDDPHVLESAKKLGHLVDKQGVSQQTAHIGMAKALISNPNLGYNASLEIITDIYFLSQCSTLVGIAASQIFRMAVAMSNASGILSYAVAMDSSQLPKIKQMSEKYHLPLPETFENPY